MRKTNRCKVIIGASIYDLIYTKETIIADGEHCYGSHHFTPRIIKVTADKDVNIQQKEETTLHEIVHGINDDRGLGLTEDQVAGISAGFYQVLRDNKELIHGFTFGGDDSCRDLKIPIN